MENEIVTNLNSIAETYNSLEDDKKFGVIMDSFNPKKDDNVEESANRVEAMKAAITNERIKQLRAISKPKPLVRDHKIGRNDPCPCGAIDEKTGKPKKYKNCCLKTGEYENYHVSKK